MPISICPTRACLWLAAAATFIGGPIFAAPVAESNQPTITIDGGQQNYLGPQSQITVRFPRAMIAEDQVGSSALIELFRLTPPLKGDWVWLDQESARFTLREQPSLSTWYVVAFDETTDVNGEATAAAESRQIMAESFRVNYPTAWPPNAGVSFERLMVFSDWVDPIQAQEFLEFKNYLSGSSLRGSVPAKARQATVEECLAAHLNDWPCWSDRALALAGQAPPPMKDRPKDSLVRHCLIVSPKEALAPGYEWYLWQNASLPNASKTATLGTNASYYLGRIQLQAIQSITPVAEVNQAPAIRINFAAPVDPKADFASLISLNPAVPNFAIKVEPQSLLLQGEFDGIRGAYELRMKGPIPTPGQTGEIVAQTSSVTFAPLDPSIGLPSFDAAQLAKGTRRYAVATRNVGQLRVRVKLLSLEDSLRALSKMASDYKGRTLPPADEVDGNQNPPIEKAEAIPHEAMPGRDVLDKTWSFDAKLNSSRSIELAWDEILPAKEPGILLVTAEGAPPAFLGLSKKALVQSIVQLTDIGLAWRLSPGEAMIHAFSCETGLPLAGTQLRLHGSTPNVMAEATTDAHGIARLPRTEGALFLSSQLGSDLNVLAFDDTLPRIPMWRFPIDVAWKPEIGPRRTVMMFTDRGLYRPGETVMVKGIVRLRQDVELKLPETREAEFSVQDHDGNELLRKKVSLSDQGTFHESITLPAEKVGKFTARLEFPQTKARNEAEKGQPKWPGDSLAEWESDESNESDDSSHAHTFRVEEFRKNTFEIKIDPVPPPIGSTHVSVPVSARYYMGQALSDAKVLWNVRSRTRGFYPKEYRDFLFGDHQGYDPHYWAYYFGYEDGYYWADPREESSHGEQFLKKDGTSTIDLELSKADFPTARGVEVRAEITDVNQQTLTESASLTVHPAEFYIGLSRVDRLVRANEEVELECLAVDTEGKPWPESVQAEMSLEHEAWETVSIKTADGTVRTLNRSERAEIQQGSITLAANGQKSLLKLRPQAAGTNYVTLRAKDGKGRETATRAHFYVYGSESYAWQQEEGARIKLVPEKRRYKPGDTARILVMTPIDGSALITVERSNVLRAFTTTLSSQKPVFELPITDQDSPNIHVSVTVIKGAAENRRRQPDPIMKLGYCTIEVENLKDRLAVEFDPLKPSYRPGASVQLGGVIKDPQGQVASGAELTLWAVDEGVLSVIGYKTPDPLAEFLPSKMPLAVRGGVSLSLFLPEDRDARSAVNKGITVGDGDGDASILAKRLRQNFDPRAFWKADIITDSVGRFAVSFPTPDSLTRYRVMAVALHGPRRMGSGISSLIVNKPMMLEPVAPRFASVGDRLIPKAILHNTSTASGEFEVSLELGPEARFTDEASSKLSKTIALEAGETKAMPFSVQFTRMGETQWRWRVEPKHLATGHGLDEAELVDWVESKFPVQFPAPVMREVHFVRVDPGARVNLLKDFDPQLLGKAHRLEAEFSLSRFVEAAEALSYNLHYPYG